MTSASVRGLGSPEITSVGTFMFFNSYLEHEFSVDHGLEPFRFIHFNLQAIPKQLINNDIKRISS